MDYDIHKRNWYKIISSVLDIVPQNFIKNILSKTSDEVNGHHYHNIDDNSYIKQELKPLYIIVQDLNDEECTCYNAQIRPCRAENCKTCTELITSNTFKSSLTRKLITLKHLNLCHVHHQMSSIPSSTAQNANSYCMLVKLVVQFRNA